MKITNSIARRLKRPQLPVLMIAASFFSGIATASINVEYFPISTHLFRFSAGSDGYLYAIEHSRRSVLQIDGRGVKHELPLEPGVPWDRKTLTASDIVEADGVVYLTLDESPGGTSPKYIRQIDTKTGKMLDTKLPWNLLPVHLTVNRFARSGSTVWFLGIPMRLDIIAPTRLVKFIPGTSDSPGSFEYVFTLGQDAREARLNGLAFDNLSQPWFTTYSDGAGVPQVGYLDSLGRVKEQPTLFTRPTGLVFGPDLSMWYWSSVGASPTATGVGKADLRFYGLTEYTTLATHVRDNMVPGADRGLWYLGSSNTIGRIHPNTGDISKFIVPNTPGDKPCSAFNLVRSSVDSTIYFTCGNEPFIGMFSP